MTRAQHECGSGLQASSGVVVALPTASMEPVKNPKRRGRLPAAVSTLTRARQARKRMSQARANIAAKYGRPDLANPSDASQTSGDRAKLAAAVGRRVCPETVNTLATLLRLAELGALTGFAGAYLMLGKPFYAVRGDLAADKNAALEAVGLLALALTEGEQ